MRVTDIRFLEGNDPRVLARVTVVIDDMMAVHGLAVMPGREGGFHLAMPRHRHADGSYRDTAHPINRETRKYLEDRVFEAYRQALIQGSIVKRQPREAEPAAS